MEIKATLQKPYTEAQRMDFIVEYNHNQGYEIRETEEAIEAWGYTEEEIVQKERESIAKLTMTPLDFINFLVSCGLTLEQINAYLETHLDVKMQLTYCQFVYCGVACSLMPVTIGDITITEELVVSAFIKKNERRYKSYRRNYTRSFKR